MMANRWLLRLLVVLPVWWAGIAPLRAAETEAGSAEAVGYGGLVAGIGTHGSLGGAVAYAATKRILAVGEFSYIPGGSQKAAGGGFAAKASARAYDFNGGIHFQFPLKEPKAVPYVGAGVGVLHGSASGTTTVQGRTYSSKVSGTDFYFNLGGGLRYYVSDRWGIRPELKIFAGDQTFVRLAIGIFYQFGK